MASSRKTRREALQALGSAGVAALVGCGGRSDGIPGGSVMAGMGGTSSGGAGSGGLITGGMGGSGGAPLVGGSGGAVQTGGSSGVGGGPSLTCIVRPQQTEGPYFVDERLERRDIRVDPSTSLVKDGVPLRVVFRVSRIDGNACAPLVGAMVDLWQCDALGVYSNVIDGAGRFDTRGQRFLRGYQLSDATGRAEFLTIYPGWYAGRTVHLHFKVRAPDPTGVMRQFVSQLYFDQALTNQVLALPPYAMNTGAIVTNDGDGIFRSGGAQLMLAVNPTESGYLGTFDLALIMS